MNGVPLPVDAPSVAAELHAAGYRTALIGKPHFEPFIDPFGRFVENSLSRSGVETVDSPWFDGTTRVITTGSGIPIPEEIVTKDDVQRRFQYRIVGPMVKEHLSTLDVLDLEDGTCLVVYAADADPSPMALIIAGAAGNALEHLRTMMEGAR